MSELTAQALELAAMTPTDFIFGAATSSWQIEGNSSSRGASIWDVIMFHCIKQILTYLAG
jgi:beta-glucosidase/6-phospho-beta-glucosidase/beta-galactosidase